MQSGIESFLLINFILDIMLMTIVSKCAGTFKLSRAIIAAVICTFLGLMGAWFPDPWYSPVLQAMMLIPIAMLITGSSSIRLWGTSALMLFSGITMASGCDHIISHGSSRRLPAIASTIFGMSILYVLLTHRRLRRNSWNIELCLSANGATARFTALIDTGNRLHEPLSGLPVLIVEKDLIESILPKAGYRSVAFGGLGGNGILKCFRPDFIWIVSGKNMKRAPDAWVAVSPSLLPGSNSALAPSEFASV